MFDFKIDNAHRAYELMQEGWPTRIVSLVGPDLNFDLPKQGDHHLIKVFHDFEGHVEPETLKDTVWDLKHPLILPTYVDVQDVLEFTNDLTEDDRLLVHCHAGRSRSAAMLIGILFNHMDGDIRPYGSSYSSRDLEVKADAVKAVQLVKEVRPTMIPNRLMIRYIDEACAGNGLLEEAVKEYWDNCTLPGIMLRTKLSGWKDE